MQLRGSVAVLHDMAEEGWPSMDQMGALLTSRLPAYAPDLSVTPIRHPMLRVASRGPAAQLRVPFFADRLLNRFVLYPRRVRASVAGRFDLYHIVDHSYSQLALDLPPDSTVITCHDVDAFRSILSENRDPRAFVFRAMTRRILQGFRRARIVVCGSEAVRDEVVWFGLADPARVRLVPNGINPALLAGSTPAARDTAAALLPPQRGVFDLLHVGTDLPRKRLDRLVEIVAALRSRGHWVRLVRVGAFRPETRMRAQELALNDVIELPFLPPDVLRAIYERCDLLLLTSDREGYGLPVIEAFAAGKPVVASDIPAVREVAGGLATCVPPDALGEWIQAVERVLSTPDQDGTHAAARRARAAAQTWDHHVRALLPVYAEILPGRTEAVA